VATLFSACALPNKRGVYTPVTGKLNMRLIQAARSGGGFGGPTDPDTVYRNGVGYIVAYSADKNPRSFIRLCRTGETIAIFTPAAENNFDEPRTDNPIVLKWVPVRLHDIADSSIMLAAAVWCALALHVPVETLTQFKAGEDAHALHNNVCAKIRAAATVKRTARKPAAKRQHEDEDTDDAAVGVSAGAAAGGSASASAGAPSTAAKVSAKAKTNGDGGAKKVTHNDVDAMLVAGPQCVNLIDAVMRRFAKDAGLKRAPVSER
jgi:hypothetical protein